jgi:hypothetical protein
VGTWQKIQGSPGGAALFHCVTTGVQLEAFPQPATLAPAYTRRLFLLLSLLLVLALGVVWLTPSFREFILQTVHPFRVIQIGIPPGTMSLVHGNRTYVVRCDQHCADFKVGSDYPMFDTGGAVEYTGAGQKMAFPVIEEQTKFDLTGGHG